MSTRAPAIPSPGSAWRLCLVPLLLLALAYAPALGGGFLSDDLLLGLLLKEGPGDALVVDWAGAFADFARPWLGIDGLPLYRPIITLSYAWDFQLGGGAAWPFHLTNLLAHALSSLAAGWIASRIFRRRAALAFLIASCSFSLHPVAAEAVIWISGRVSSIEVMFRLLACCAYLRWLERGARRDFLLCYLLAALALLSKESAVLLFICLPALDWLADPGVRLRQRLQRLLPFVPLALAYFALRLLVLGQFLGDMSPEGVAQASAFTITSNKVLALLSPLGLLQGSWLLQVLSFVLISLLLLLADRRLSLRVAPLLLLWLVLLTLPSLSLTLSPDLTGSRLVYGAALIPALLFAHLSCHSKRKLSVALTLVLAAQLLPALLDRSQAYQQGYASVAQLQQGLLQQAANSSPKRPLAVLGIPSRQNGVPLLNSNAVHPLLQRPFARRDHFMIGLACLLESFRGSSELYLDMTPLGVLARAGMPIALWTGSEFTSLRLDAQRSRSDEPGAQARSFRWPVSKQRGEHGLLARLDFTPALSALDEIRVQVSGKLAAGFELRGYQPGGARPAFTIRVDAQPGPRSLRLSQRYEVLATEVAGGISALELVREGHTTEAAASAECSVEIAARRSPELAERPLLSLGELLAKLAREYSEEDAHGVVLLGPHAGHRTPLPRNGAPVDPQLRSIFRNVPRISRTHTIYYYLVDEDGAPRSPLRAFELRQNH